MSADRRDRQHQRDLVYKAIEPHKRFFGKEFCQGDATGKHRKCVCGHDSTIYSDHLFRSHWPAIPWLLAQTPLHLIPMKFRHDLESAQLDGNESPSHVPTCILFARLCQLAKELELKDCGLDHWHSRLRSFFFERLHGAAAIRFPDLKHPKTKWPELDWSSPEITSLFSRWEFYPVLGFRVYWKVESAVDDQTRTGSDDPTFTQWFRDGLYAIYELFFHKSVPDDARNRFMNQLESKYGDEWKSVSALLDVASGRSILPTNSAALQVVPEQLIAHPFGPPPAFSSATDLTSSLPPFSDSSSIPSQPDGGRPLQTFVVEPCIVWADDLHPLLHEAEITFMVEMHFYLVDFGSFPQPNHASISFRGSTSIFVELICDPPSSASSNIRPVKFQVKSGNLRELVIQHGAKNGWFKPEFTRTPFDIVQNRATQKLMPDYPLTFDLHVLMDQQPHFHSTFQLQFTTARKRQFSVGGLQSDSDADRSPNNFPHRESPNTSNLSSPSASCQHSQAFSSSNNANSYVNPSYNSLHNASVQKSASKSRWLLFGLPALILIACVMLIVYRVYFASLHQFTTSVSLAVSQSWSLVASHPLQLPSRRSTLLAVLSQIQPLVDHLQLRNQSFPLPNRLLQIIMQTNRRSELSSTNSTELTHLNTTHDQWSDSISTQSESSSSIALSASSSSTFAISGLQFIHSNVLRSKLTKIWHSFRDLERIIFLRYPELSNCKFALELSVLFTVFSEQLVHLSSDIVILEIFQLSLVYVIFLSTTIILEGFVLGCIILIGQVTYVFIGMMYTLILHRTRSIAALIRFLYPWLDQTGRRPPLPVGIRCLLMDVCIELATLLITGLFLFSSITRSALSLFLVLFIALWVPPNDRNRWHFVLTKWLLPHPSRLWSCLIGSLKLQFNPNQYRSPFPRSPHLASLELMELAPSGGPFQLHFQPARPRVNSSDSSADESFNLQGPECLIPLRFDSIMNHWDSHYWLTVSQCRTQVSLDSDPTRLRSFNRPASFISEQWSIRQILFAVLPDSGDGIEVESGSGDHNANQIGSSAWFTSLRNRGSRWLLWSPNSNASALDRLSARSGCHMISLVELHEFPHQWILIRTIQLEDVHRPVKVNIGAVPLRRRRRIANSSVSAIASSDSAPSPISVLFSSFSTFCISSWLPHRSLLPLFFIILTITKFRVLGYGFAIFHMFYVPSLVVTGALTWCIHKQLKSARRFVGFFSNQAAAVEAKWWRRLFRALIRYVCDVFQSYGLPIAAIILYGIPFFVFL